MYAVLGLGLVGKFVLAGVWKLAHHTDDNKVRLRCPGTLRSWLAPPFIKAGVMCLIVPTIALIVWPWAKTLYMSIQLPGSDIILYTATTLFAATLVLISANLIIRVVRQAIRTSPSRPVLLQLLSDNLEEEWLS